MANAKKLNEAEFNNIINAYNKKNKFGMSKEDFLNHAERYIKACKEGRLMCSIGSVSNSGMSRSMKFFEMSKEEGRHFIFNFYRLFDSLGFTKIKDSDYFRITGCGMDMVFHTNYTIIRQFHYMGIIDKKLSDQLSQNTPHCV